MSRKIEDLIPDLQTLYFAFERTMRSRGIDFTVTCTRRTQEEQDELYAQGRTKPGPVVTWTRNSRHVDGTAFDIAVKKNGKVSWNPKDYVLAGAIGESLGLEWGGAWRKPDMPHFQLKKEE